MSVSIIITLAYEFYRAACLDFSKFTHRKEKAEFQKTEI